MLGENLCHNLPIIFNNYWSFSRKVDRSEETANEEKSRVWNEHGFICFSGAINFNVITYRFTGIIIHVHQHWNKFYWWWITIFWCKESPNVLIIFFLQLNWKSTVVLLTITWLIKKGHCGFVLNIYTWKLMEMLTMRN